MLTEKEIKHIATLAKLELTAEEIKKYPEQLSGILNYVEQLKAVNVIDIEPTAQVTNVVNQTRIDDVKSWPNIEREQALAQAGELEGKQIKVRRILD